MDFLIFFLFLFFSVSLLVFYYKLGVLYLGIGAGAVFIILGLTLAMNNSSLSATHCFSDQINKTVFTTYDEELSPNYTVYGYGITCETEDLPLDRSIFNLVGLMLIITGAGVIVDVHRIFTKKESY